MNPGALPSTRGPGRSRWGALGRLLGRYRRFASPASILAYSLSRRLSRVLAAWGRPHQPSLKLRRPFRGRIVLRPGTSDSASFREVFELGIYDHVLEHVQEAETIVDLGANIGLATLRFGHHYERSRLVAVEPDPETFAVLERNLRPLVAAGRCRTLRAAVWSRPCELRLVEGGELGAMGASVSEERTTGAIQVPAVTLATVLELSRFRFVDLLKVDVEGAEVELFAGSCEWLDRIGAIAMEFHGSTRSVTRFDSLMAERGFEIVFDEPHTTLAVRRRPPVQRAGA